MTGFDQSQSRLGQPTPVDSTTVTMFTGSDIPEASWDGRIIYRPDRQVLQIYRTATDAYEDVTGGVAGLLTFVGSSIPLSIHAGDIWFDSAHGNKMYRAASAGADAITSGEWVLMQDSAAALSAATSAASAVTTLSGTVSSLSSATLNDGAVPPQVTGVVISGGVQSVVVNWTTVTNHDPVTYKVYGTNSTGFTPVPTNYLGESRGNSFVATQVYNGTTMTSPLVPGTTYYFRVIAVDADGPGTASTEASGTPAQVTSSDIVANAVTTGKLAANAVTAAQLAANAVTAGAISAGAIDGQTITGATILTAASPNPRWVVSTSGATDSIQGYTGDSAERYPAVIKMVGETTDGYLGMYGPDYKSTGAVHQAFLELEGESAATDLNAGADHINIGAATDMFLNAGADSIQMGSGIIFNIGNALKGLYMGTLTATITAAVIGTTTTITHAIGNTNYIALATTQSVSFGVSLTTKTNTTAQFTVWNRANTSSTASITVGYALIAI